MSENRLSQLLDRAVQQAPSMDLDAEQVLGAGRRRVRRRRLAGAGLVAAGAVVVAGAWIGVGRAGLVDGVGTADPAATGVVLEHDGEVTLTDEPFTQRNGELTIESLVLRTAADGSSSVEARIDGVTATAEGRDVVHGRARSYVFDQGTLYLFPARSGARRELLGEIPEAVQGEASSGGEDLAWAFVVGQGHLDDVLYLDGAQADTLSGETAHADTVGQDLIVWDVPGLDRWGVLTGGPSGGAGAQAAPDSDRLAFTQDDGPTVWAARLPSVARHAKLVDADGAVLDDQGWITSLGGTVVVGGPLADLPVDTTVLWTPDEDPGNAAWLETDVAGLQVATTTSGEAVLDRDGFLLKELGPRLWQDRDGSTLLLDGDSPTSSTPVSLLGGSDPAAVTTRPGQPVELSGGEPGHAVYRMAGSDEDLLGVALPVTGAEGTANTWNLVELSVAHVVLDPGVVVAAGGGEHDPWLLYPQGSTDPDAVRAGVNGRSLLAVPGADRGPTTYLAVVPSGSEVSPVVQDGAVVSDARISELTGDVELWSGTVDRSEGSGLLGLDLDGDGEVDLPVTS